MSRYVRRKDPPLRRVQNIDLPEGNITLRLLGFGVALLIAAISFGYLLNSALTPDAGWQEITIKSPETGITNSFTLYYNLGTGDTKTARESKTVSRIYSSAADTAYRVLSNVAVEDCRNIRYLNDHPNEAVQVDETLYRTLEAIVSDGSRYVYFAPLFSYYDSLYSSLDDTMAAAYDPYLSEELGEYASEIAAFAGDSMKVNLEMLSENTVRLSISSDYLAYALENEISGFIDLGFLRDAFILDSVADALVRQGYTNALITADSGYSASLCEVDCSQNVFNGKQVAAIAQFQGPSSVVNIRPYADGSSYVYEDGTARGNILDADGKMIPMDRNLIVLSDSLSCGGLALKAIGAYSVANPASRLQGLSLIVSENGAVEITGTAFTLK